jgi:predicted ATPase
MTLWNLFCEQADVTTTRVAELCRRLDDLPLAVEAGCGLATVLSPAQILERLSGRLDLLKGGRDAEGRSRRPSGATIGGRTACSTRPSGCYSRLSVFRGGFTLEAARSICDADLDVISSLVSRA